MTTEGDKPRTLLDELISKFATVELVKAIDQINQEALEKKTRAYMILAFTTCKMLAANEDDDIFNMEIMAPFRANRTLLRQQAADYMEVLRSMGIDA